MTRATLSMPTALLKRHQACQWPAAGSIEDAALGCMLGAHVGDAAGAVLEFVAKARITPLKVEAALSMPGGGVFGVGPGQITDDSELALCLADALSSTAASTGFPAEAAALAYKRWFRSQPFDIGNTCRNAFGCSDSDSSSSPAAHTSCSATRDSSSSAPVCISTSSTGAPASSSPVSERMRAAARGAMHSAANGALMRATPLAVWGHRLSDEQLAKAARADAQLSHPNQTTQDANAVYCIALKHLINHAHDAEGAVAAAEAWAAAHACVDIQSWMTESATPGPGPKCSANIGYVKWGFVYAFRGLRRRLQYREGLAEVLLQGGDTDTNAAIVGGMLGALHGAVNGIPQEMSGVVLSRSLMSQGQPRPGWLLSRRVPGMVQKLLECAAE